MLPDGMRVFEKAGVNDSTKQWARKEIQVYHFLQRQNYPFIPQMFAHNHNETGLVLEALTSLLVNVHRAGLDVTRAAGDRLNADARHWMAGFWLKATATPIWPGGPAHVRDVQLQSVLTAWKLAGISSGLPEQTGKRTG